MSDSGIIPADAKLEQVFDGATFSEGPAADIDGKVYFSDCPENKILCFDPETGKTTVWKDPSQRANGMNFDYEGRLVTCCAGGPDLPGGARSVLRYEKDGSITNLASHYDGKPLNAPNDLCFDREGRIYFTDPRYGDRSDIVQDCMAVYRINLDGSLTRVIEDMEFPNGILISEDNRTLYLVDHNPDPGGTRTLVAYDVDDSGNWSRRKVFYDFGDGYGGDGMVLDIHGNIYLTAGKEEKAGIYIFSPEGDLLDVIKLPEIPGNCTFGGADLRTLYIAATSSLYRIKLAYPGLLAFPKVTNT